MTSATVSPGANMYGRRRIGLSSQQNPPRLLNKIRNISDRPPVKQLKVPKAIDDPPVSSDDEDGTETGNDLEAERTKRSPAKKLQGRRSPANRPTGSILDGSETSGDERAAKASIKRTTFGSSNPAGASRMGTRSRRRDALKDEESRSVSPSKKRRLNETTSDGHKNDFGNSSSQNRSGKTPPSSGEHLKDSRGFTKIRRSKVTYKKSHSSSQEVPERKGTKSLLSLVGSDSSFDADLMTSSPKLKVPDVLKSPTKPKSTKLRLRTSPGPSSPDDVPPAKAAKRASPTKQSLKSISPVESSQGTTGSRRTKQTLGKTKFGVSKSPSPPPATFKLPATLSELKLRPPNVDMSIDSSFLDSFAEVDDHNNKEGTTSNEVLDRPEAEARAVCPWCGDPVDEMLLVEFSKGKRLNVRQQSKFCQKHKKQTATETWEQRSYPQVEWDGLGDRFSKYRSDMLGIVKGEASHFRSIHEQNIQAGKARSMKKEENMNPGYYGPRGFNLMCDYLVSEFGDLLKQQAVDDRVIAGRGSAAFIQTVLVAELAVRLVMEDMNVSEEDARAIMEESKALGEIVNEDT